MVKICKNMESNDLREFGKFTLDAGQKVLWFDGTPVNLHLKQIELLCVLTENPGNVIRKQDIFDRVWAESFVEESNLSRHIYRLRKVFEEYGESGEVIQTVPRRGYRFTASIQHSSGDEIVIERHSTTRTLIEHLENSEEPKFVISPVHDEKSSSNRFSILILACVAILVTSVTAYFYQNQRVKSAALQGIRTLAVLPLRSLDSENQSNALNLGFADTLITKLAELNELNILSSNAVSRFADEDRDPVEVGRKLGADAVLDGSIQRANGELRITLRLVQVSDGSQLWSRSFDDLETEIFRLQDSMAIQTASALRLNLAPRVGTDHPTDNLEAYNLYLQGQYLFRRRETTKSVEFFKRATEIDPKFAKAWAGLAAAYAMGDSMPQAEPTINKALALAPDLAEAHAVRGFVKMFLAWDWREAETSLDRAVSLDPNLVEAHHWRGIFLLIHGRLDESRIEIERALELYPTSANLISDLGQVFYFSRQFDRAEEQYIKADLIDDKFAVGRLAQLYRVQKRDTEAFEIYIADKCRSLTGIEQTACFSKTRESFERSGIAGISRENLELYLTRSKRGKFPEGFEATEWFGTAISYMELNETAKAGECLKNSVETRIPFGILNFTLPFIAFDPQFDSLRGDQNYQAVLRKMNL